jgi:hypothetical protein
MSRPWRCASGLNNSDRRLVVDLSPAPAAGDPPHSSLPRHRDSPGRHVGEELLPRQIGCLLRKPCPAWCGLQLAAWLGVTSTIRSGPVYRAKKVVYVIAIFRSCGAISVLSVLNV